MVPLHLRAIAGKRKLLQSTGSLAGGGPRWSPPKSWPAGAACCTSWNTARPWTILQLTTGSPELHLGGLLSLHEASVACGQSPADLVRAAAQGTIGLFIDRANAAEVKGHLRLTAAVNAYINERSRRCAPDQARRIRTACELFVYLIGDMPVQAVTRDLLREYRDKKLPLVPAKKNKIRVGDRPD